MIRTTRSTQFLALGVTVLALFQAPRANATMILADFDVSHATSASTASIPVIVNAPGVTTSPLIPIGINYGGVSGSPGLYWDSAWTTASSPNFDTQRLFFNLIPNVGATIQVDKLDFFINSGGSSYIGVDLRAWDGVGTSIYSPNLHQAGAFNSPTNFASEVIFDVSSLPAIHYGGGYQFSLSFFNRDPSKRIGLSGDRPDFGVYGGDMVLTGLATVPEPATITLLVSAFFAIGTFRLVRPRRADRVRRR